MTGTCTEFAVSTLSATLQVAMEQAKSDSPHWISGSLSYCTNSVGLSPSSEAASLSDTQELHINFMKLETTLPYSHRVFD
jgi:hypothetical protein